MKFLSYVSNIEKYTQTKFKEYTKHGYELIQW